MLTVAIGCLLASTAQARSGSQPPQPSAAASLTSLAAIEPAGETAVVTFSNRRITVLRARVLGRLPSERASGAVRSLEDLVRHRTVSPVEVRTLEGSQIVVVAGRTVLVMTPLDIDEAAGETLDVETARAVSALQLALAEAIEARTPAMLLWGVLLSLLAIALAAVLLLAIARGHRKIARRLIEAAERQLARAGTGSLEVLRASRLFDFWRRLITLVSVVLGLVVVYTAVTFTLRRFPYTRPWGESMRAYLVSTLSTLVLDMVHAIPALFVVVVIIVIARFFIRLLHVFFKAIEQGSVNVPWLHPETVQPTRRLLSALLWLFAAVMAYPYLPGSGTDAFKGASVFVGLVLSLGSSGLVNQIMSGFMITYSRALRLNDFVRVGEIEGNVTQVGVLSTKIKTLRGEEITIPNAFVVATTTTNYSRFADAEGVYAPTSLTIGYDTPWRQVQALLLMAAERTAGVRKEPAPRVLKSELQDFYVKYTLLVCPERPEVRPRVMNVLHEHILDLFNEYGVQIMSPNYEADPEGQKIVPKERWHAAPAGGEK
jgi:small-conductance mechanosensitive channel